VARDSLLTDARVRIEQVKDEESGEQDLESLARTGSARKYALRAR
jgi:hypothetical protein